ncbi:hypothetical protein [Psychroflexus halocasei]|uniref:Uncharacterized protein n=1 Tax=Psychroflexus halocasei TaxID=908615 RepID=A0A1H3W1D9_9FLAO|nr:hypothetical protein [Psychroflexus halocasei]SDZ80138.1 hypothetical protein SAMN05421540_101353 [Psychroflexus halocasei]
MDKKETIKSRIKTLKSLFYFTGLVWIGFLIYTIYVFMNRAFESSLLISLLLIVSAMMILQYLKKNEVKKLKQLEEEE